MLLAFPTLRLFGIYTSLLTFSFAQVVQYVALNDPAGITGGSFGFPTVRGLFSDADQRRFCAPTTGSVSSIVVLSRLAVAWLRQSRLGIALRSTATRRPTPRRAGSIRLR